MLAVIGKPNPILLNEFQGFALTGNVRETMQPGHNDGWGIAGFVENKPVYFGRSASSATNDNDYTKAAEQAAQAQPTHLIAHIRKATGGEVNLQNSHPFIKNGWIFCHNGTIHSAETLNVKGELEGSTDSERFFLYLLETLKSANSFHSITNCLSEIIADVKQTSDYTSLTFFLANEQYLIAYRDINENSKEAASFNDYYTFYKARTLKNIIISSEPLGDLEFSPLTDKELLIISVSDQRTFHTFLK